MGGSQSLKTSDLSTGVSLTSITNAIVDQEKCTFFNETTNLSATSICGCVLKLSRFNVDNVSSPSDNDLCFFFVLSRFNFENVSYLQSCLIEGGLFQSSFLEVVEYDQIFLACSEGGQRWFFQNESFVLQTHSGSKLRKNVFPPPRR